MQYNIPEVIEGVKVTMLDANQSAIFQSGRYILTDGNVEYSCPGSSLFLFEGPQTLPGSPYAGTDKQFRYLHCGDVRALY
jgi:hypothetical protein